MDNGWYFSTKDSGAEAVVDITRVSSPWTSHWLRSNGPGVTGALYLPPINIPCAALTTRRAGLVDRLTIV